MTKVERLYEIEDELKDLRAENNFSNLNKANQAISLVSQREVIIKSFTFKIEIKGLVKKLNVDKWGRLSNICITWSTPMDDKYNGETIYCTMRCDNLIELIEFMLNKNIVDNIDTIHTHEIITKLIIDNYDYIKSHEYSDKLITLLSSDNIANIELVITMLELVEFEEPIRKPYKI